MGKNVSSYSQEGRRDGIHLKLFFIHQRNRRANFFVCEYGSMWIKKLYGQKCIICPQEGYRGGEHLKLLFIHLTLQRVTLFSLSLLCVSMVVCGSYLFSISVNILNFCLFKGLSTIPQFVTEPTSLFLKTPSKKSSRICSLGTHVKGLYVRNGHYLKSFHKQKWGLF